MSDEVVKLSWRVQWLRVFVEIAIEFGTYFKDVKIIVSQFQCSVYIYLAS